MINWPLTLPIPSTSYALSTDAVMSIVQMETGRFRQRNRVTKPVYQLSALWEFTDAEYQVFVAFVRKKLNNGADSFSLPIVSGGGVTNSNVKIISGKYNSTYVDVLNWKVKATLEVENINELPEQILDLILEYGYDEYEFNSLLKALENCVNRNLL